MENKTQNIFIEKFQKELEITQNKDYLIENEIEQIKFYTTNRGPNNGKLINNSAYNQTNSVFDLSYFGKKNYIIDVFHEYLKNGFTDDTKVDVLSKHIHQTAESFAQYYLWLKELKTPKSKSKYSDLNNEQKLLALHFLFPDLRDYSKTQTAIVLGQILNIGSENIRRNLSDMHKKNSKIRTVENFEKLIDLFENKTFETISNKLEREIKQLS